MMRLVAIFCALAALPIAIRPATAGTDMATYRLTVSNTWSEASHPGNFPEDAHFSWISGATHTPAVSFWDAGQLASPGVVQMAETGVTNILVGEIQNAVATGTAGAVLNWQHWFCPQATTNAACGPAAVEFRIDAAFPLVSLLTMLGPSPDWFVGVSGLPLRDAAGWRDEVTVDLVPYDGGTRDQNVFELFGPLTTPQAPVTLITAASGQRIGPQSLGTLHFERIDGASAPSPVPATGPFATLAIAGLLLAAAAAISPRKGSGLFSR